MIELNKFYVGESVNWMKENLPDNFVDLTVTSPPYDNLRKYKGFEFDYKSMLGELYRVTKEGGVVVWIVNDATIKGSETGTSFKQALYSKEVGFNLHDTMIWNKGTFTAVGSLKSRYAPVFEYMFIFTKGKLKTFNPIKDRENISYGRKKSGTFRQSDGSTKPLTSLGKEIPKYGQRFNIWDIYAEKSNKKRLHPAMFPEGLAQDHILSWSNEGDVVFDPMCGSGTACKMAYLNKRNFIGIDISEEYINEICVSRLKECGWS